MGSYDGAETYEFAFIHRQPLKSRIPQRILKPSFSLQLNSPFVSTSSVSKSYEQESINTSNIALNKFPLTEARFQYKVLHKLQEILEEIKKQGEKNELPDYSINRMSDLDGFNEFDQGLNDICQHTRLRTQLFKIGGVSCYTNVKLVLLNYVSLKKCSVFI
ncbi:uncharacterized protein LOC124819071 [Hydra vulgaris]|uniref:uncharacterized protein LOC124819071 n=1 Tax=Hydra vulgaris TaxID=6087 RepID=UPI001F5EFABA|nr:uncharacterized protein LOC124819071 [Hydra vulgaris]